METETISSRNIVDLLLNDQFKTSLCGPRLSGGISPAAESDDLVYGWDC
jgi:prenylcysteine oxidase / farnesylcysteine lyase